MKPAVRGVLSTAILLCLSFCGQTQILKNIGNRIKQKAEQRADSKVDQTIDKGLDKTEDATKTNKPADNTNNSGQKTQNGQSIPNALGTTGITDPGNGASFKTYSKFDFIPGDK